MKKSGERRNKKVGIGTAAFAVLLTLAFAGTAFGGEPGWSNEADGWYYYLPDGTPGTGWVQVDGVYYCLSDTGKCFLDIMTPDGYYVNESGAWYQRGTQILGIRTAAPGQFLPVGAEWNRSESLATLQYTIGEVFGGARLLRVTDSAIEYVSVDVESSGSVTVSGNQTGASETVLCGIYKEAEQGRYRLDIRMKLSRERMDGRTAATYDYEMFRTMVYQISSAPEILGEALYSAWQGENLWKINRENWVDTGDCQVMYTAGNGLGRFYIKPRSAE